MQNDAEANLAHFALQKLRILPHVLFSLPQRERAFIYASIDLRVEAEKREAGKVKGGRRSRRR